VDLTRLAAAAAAATLTLTLAPAAATAAVPGPVPLTENVSVGAAGNPRPIISEEPAPPPAVRKRKTDTLSLYRQAALAPPQRVQRRILGSGDVTSRELAAFVASTAATVTDSAGNVLPPDLREHVDQTCTGDGADGARVQVMYVREEDQPDRYDEVAPVLRNEMRYIDDAFAVSSMETGGGRRVRWVHDGSCSLSVLNVVLPDGAITGTHATTEAALNQAGYLEPNRKYLAFADTPMGWLDGMACGQGTLYADTSPTDNLNDGRYPQLARVDLECWVTDARYNAAPLHELLHTLGAVQPEAPHGTGGFHCTDGAETMCYNDGTATVQDICTGMQHDIDCNNDDYFNTDPAPGSYLATHWNTASSPFLETVPRLADPPTLRVTPSGTTAEAGDPITFTADVPSGAEVEWSTDTPQCETDAAKSGTTFTIRCWDTWAPTVTATASYPAGYTASTVNTNVTYTQAPYPSIAFTAPTSAPEGSPFTLGAELENAKGTWSYEWTGRTDGCTITSGTTGSSIQATCGSSVVGGFAYFTVTASRAEDGMTLVDTTGVDIVSAGTPQVTVTGPTSVRAGEQATFTATVTNAEQPTYRWYSQHGWGESTSKSVTVAVPATAGSGTDVLYLTVTASTGERVSVQHTYTVEAGLSMSMSGPTKVTSGETATFTVTPSKSATVTWSHDQGACHLVQDSLDQGTARLTCPVSFDGGVRVTATATTGSETTTRSRLVTVAPNALEPHDARLTLTASTGYPTTFKVKLVDADDGSAVAGRTVQLERRSPGGSYSVVAKATTSYSGTAYIRTPVTRAAPFRVRFLGDADYSKTVTAERLVKVYTRLGNAKTRAGLKATLQTGWGKGLARASVVLQRRVVGTKRWVKVRAYRTNRYGVVKVRTNPAKRTDFRWRYTGTTTYIGSGSGIVRLR